MKLYKTMLIIVPIAKKGAKGSLDCKCFNLKTIKKTPTKAPNMNEINIVRII